MDWDQGSLAQAQEKHQNEDSQGTQKQAGLDPTWHKSWLALRGHDHQGQVDPAADENAESHGSQDEGATLGRAKKEHQERDCPIENYIED
jgi:hypothetical protein